MDHGKSTLSDRLLQATGTLHADAATPQFLDKLQVEKERGVTVKAQTVGLMYDDHLLNLIDTPGHVDFSYEVSRSMAACQGALLLVDASQGMAAQTVANFWLALDAGVTCIPVINKIDLPTADVPRIMRELAHYDFAEEDVICVSAKSGVGVDDVLRAIVDRVPPPTVAAEDGIDAPLRALVYDVWYDMYRGVGIMAHIVAGSLSKGQKVAFCQGPARAAHEVTHLGIHHPEEVAMPRLGPGQTGFVYPGIKSVRDVQVGDTMFVAGRPPPAGPIPGFKPVQHMVFAGIYPLDGDQFEMMAAAAFSVCCTWKSFASA